MQAHAATLAARGDLIGGAGSDMFRFDSALNPFVNVDGITDFSVADDTIYLSRSVSAPSLPTAC